jgi:L-iditol 2-dehydrogenase
MAKNRARINLFGGLPKDDCIVPIDTNLLHYKEIFLFGSHGALPRHLDQSAEIIASGRIDVKKYISHRFPLSQAPDAFAAAEDKVGLRVVISPE